MDFNVKKIVKDAGVALSRVVQKAEETLGTSEKTELDAHFENLWNRAENTKNYTDKIVRNAEAVLVPNPGNRIEDFVYEKIEKKRPSRLSNLEYLGLDMVEAGNSYGPGTAYGSSLIKVGQWEQKLGQTERDFIGSAGMCFTQPLRKFLETEMKTIIKEKNLLEIKRLDLDACKNRVRKARSALGQPSAERDLRIAQSEFDRQAEITKLLLEGISSSHASHLRCLQEFVDTQARFYSQCTTIMTDLQRELTSISSTLPSPISSCDKDSTPQEGDMKQAKVLYDYEAKDSRELNLTAHEITFFLGTLVSEVLNYILKQMICEARPLRRDEIFVEYGMPSSHAQFVWFFATYVIYFVFIKLHHMNNNTIIENLSKFLIISSSLLMALLVCISRIYLQYHTFWQVLCGAVVGILFATFWFALTYLIFTPLFPQVVSWKISEILLLRDTTLIPNVLWFEYTNTRQEVRARSRKLVSMKSQ